MDTKQKVLVLALLSVIFCGAFLGLVNAKSSPQTSNSPVPSDTTGQSPYIHLTQVTRDVSITNYLLTDVTDTYTLQNNGTTAITRFSVYTDSLFDAKLIYIASTGAAGETFPLTKTTLTVNGFSSYEIVLSEPLMPGETQTVTVTMCYANVSTTIGNDTVQTCSFSFSLYPITSLPIDSVSTSISFPATVANATYTPDPISRVLIPLSATWIVNTTLAFSRQLFTANFEYDSFPILQMTSVNRRITIDPWQLITVQEDCVIYNTGSLTVNALTFRVPVNATNFAVTDAFDVVQGATMNANPNSDGKTINVTLDLTSNRASLLAGGQFQCTLTYNLPFSLYASSSWNQYSCVIQTFCTTVDFLVLSSTTQILLKAGTVDQDTSVSISPSPSQVLVGDLGTTVTYFDTMVSPLQQRIVQIQYSVNSLSVIFRPLIFILLFLGASVIYVYQRKVMRKETATIIINRTKIPVKDLEQFISLYEEKTALQQELTQLKVDIKVKKVVKKAFNKRLKDIEVKSKELEEDLKPLRITIAEADEKFHQITEKLQFIEAERISVEDSMQTLDARNRQGKIPSRSAFQTLNARFTKKLEEIQRNTDKLLSELRSYIS